ncbi:MAG: hypothetical protein AB7F75_01125, partial [Planctomycetota bacterium]
MLKNDLFCTESIINLLTIYEEKDNENNNAVEIEISIAEKISSFLFIEKKGILKNNKLKYVKIKITTKKLSLNNKSKNIFIMFHVKHFIECNT